MGENLAEAEDEAQNSTEHNNIPLLRFDPIRLIPLRDRIVRTQGRRQKQYEQYLIVQDQESIHQINHFRCISQLNKVLEADREQEEYIQQVFFSENFCGGPSEGRVGDEDADEHWEGGDEAAGVAEFVEEDVGSEGCMAVEVD